MSNLRKNRNDFLGAYDFMRTCLSISKCNDVSGKYCVGYTKYNLYYLLIWDNLFKNHIKCYIASRIFSFLEIKYDWLEFQIKKQYNNKLPIILGLFTNVHGEDIMTVIIDTEILQK